MATLQTQVNEGQKKWETGIDLTSTTTVTEYLKFKLLEYEYYNFKDDDLWEQFKEDFKAVTEEILKGCSQPTIRKLRTFLRHQGVWIAKDKHITVARSLYNTLHEEDQAQWSKEDILEHIKTNGPFNSYKLNKESGITIDLSVNPSKHTSIIDQDEAGTMDQDEAGTMDRDESGATDAMQSKNYGKELANLAKLYTADAKYSGENDNFDYKLTIFLDLCGKASIPSPGLTQAYSTMLKGLALDHYYTNLKNNPVGVPFNQLCNATRNYFEGPEYKRSVLQQWNAISLQTTIDTNTGKSMVDCLQLLIKELRHLQHGLDNNLKTDEFLHNKLITACQGLDACKYACYKPADTLAGLINDLRSSITTYETPNPQSSTQVFQNEPDPGITQAYFTDRRYHRQNQYRSNYPRNNLSSTSINYPARRHPNVYPRKRTNHKCFVCDKEGCWSTRHTQEEREKSKKKFDNQINQYILDYEGDDDDEEGFDRGMEMEALIIDFDSDDQEQGPNSEAFLTTFGAFTDDQAFDTTTVLADRSFAHAIAPATTPVVPVTIHTDQDPFAYIATPERYTSKEFFGIMIDTGASKKSTAGYGQYLAYKKTTPVDVNIDTTYAGAVNVQFGIGSTASIGSISVDTPIGVVNFHIVKADTPFLLCLADMDSLQAYYNNVTDALVTPSVTLPVTRRFGHPFLIWGETLKTYIQQSFEYNPCYLTTVEIQRLHRRFGHPSAEKLHKVLERSGHDDVDKKAIDHLTKFCSFCQKYGRSPGRFKFTLREDLDFNHSIFVDIMYINGNPVLHIIDEATRYQAARWLQNVSAKHTWDILRACWIDTYVGPPEFVVHDAGKNFVSKEFQQYATSMAISTKAVPVEAHWSVGLIERAHPALRRAYQIITEECQDIRKDLALQMAVKAVNDTAGPDGLVPTLLVYGAYPRMSNLDPPAPSVTERAKAIRKAMAEVRKIRAVKAVNDALNHRNGPVTTPVHGLPLNSEVLVWREGDTGQSGKWTGPYTLLAMDGETCQVQLRSGPVSFRSTVVKPYLRSESDLEPEVPQSMDATETQEPLNSAPAHRRSNRLRKQPEVQEPDQPTKSYQLRRGPSRPGKNTVPADVTVHLQNLLEPRFTNSRRTEVNGLLEKGVFAVVTEDSVPYNTRIFNSRFVDEIKHPGTDKAFEKSRLVVQAYNDQGKNLVLTQSPTIQRVSQRIILALAPSLQQKSAALYLRDISQAYVQSNTRLSRDIFIRPPPEIGLRPGTILQVLKPLYGVPEAGNHWFSTYHRHHINQLQMDQSTYDPCLLHTSTKGFGIVGLQTDDTLFLADPIFANAEEAELKKAKFLAKDREELTVDHPIKFNGGKITLQHNGQITLTQERQAQNLRTITDQPTDLTSSRGEIRKAVDLKDQYVAQRARGAYVATVCQPEAAFDLSFAAQVTDPQKENINYLNKRIQWQIDNPLRGLTFTPLDLESLSLVVFTDASFANNRDLSSQIGFVIVLTDRNQSANIVHWSSIKCKRITRSVLASELYALAHGFDIGVAIKTTIQNILQSKQLPLVLCTDSKSLYECLVKLGTTQEKRLIVDLICLRQSYERREIAEIKWIEGGSNPADAMTKSKPCQALKTLIDTNRLDLQVTEWVERDGEETDGIRSDIIL
jgi:hypothetical protein